MKYKFFLFIGESNLVSQTVYTVYNLFTLLILLTKKKIQLKYTTYIELYCFNINEMHTL